MTKTPERKQNLLSGTLWVYRDISRVWVTVWVRQLIHILTHTIFDVFAAKKHRKTKFSMLYGAAGRIRTADLILTKDALYLLSYSSKCGDQEGARTLDLQRDRLAF